jgi:alkylhydroperoxidase family enzyme
VKGLDRETVGAVLADWRTAPVSDRLRATLNFLETLTLRPTEVNATTMRCLKAAGVSDRAIREATYVCFLFNVLDRLADALDFTLPTKEEAQKIGNITFRLGYGIAKLPG